MAAGLDKLRAVLPTDRQDHVERLARQTVVYGSAFGAVPDSGQQSWLLALQKSVVNRHVLELRYAGYEREETTREVEPLGVVYSGGAWYLIAWCRLRQDFRQFRIDRIRDLSVSSERFEHRPDFSLREHLEKESEGEETIRARIWIADPMQGKARMESYATLIEENERDGGREFSHYTFLSNGSRGGSSRLGRPQKRLIRRSWAIGLRGSPKRRWRNIRSDQPRRVLLTRPSFPDSRSA